MAKVFLIFLLIVWIWLLLILARILKTKKVFYAIPLPILIAAGYLALARSGHVDFPTWLDRSFIHPMDTRILSRTFGEPLPQSFRLGKANLMANDFPAPDGPRPAAYVIEIEARDLPALMEHRHWKLLSTTNTIHTNLSFLLNNQKRSREVADERIRSKYESSVLTADYYEILNSEVKFSGGSIIVDKISTPSLTLYLDTLDPYLSRN